MEDFNSPQHKLSFIDWGKKILVANGRAYQGQWRMNDSEYYYVDDPTVAINDKGALAVAWADNSRKEIFLQRYSASGEPQLISPINISRSPNIFSWLPRMIIIDSYVYIIWQEIVFSGARHGGEIYFSFSKDAGKNFSQPANLSNTASGAGKGRLTNTYWDNGSMDLKIGLNENLYAVWTDYEGALFLRRSVDKGQNFSKTIKISEDNSSPARGPSLGVDSKGNIHIVWSVRNNENSVIYYTTSADHGQSFQDPKIVGNNDGCYDAPKIVIDKKNTVHLVFTNCFHNFLRQGKILYTRKASGKHKFDEPIVLSRYNFENVHSVGFPELDIDANDFLYVIWELFPDSRASPQGLGFTHSVDGGNTFEIPSLVPGVFGIGSGTNGGRQGLLMRKLAVNKFGAFAVVNSTFKINESSNIWLIIGQRRSSALN